MIIHVSLDMPPIVPPEVGVAVGAGVGSVLPIGVKTAWYRYVSPYPWLTLYGLSVGFQLTGALP